MLKAKDVNTSNVTDEQVGRCHKCFSGSIPFYLVESETDNLTEYKVTWDRERGFRCTCKAGQHGFAHCKNNVCKHVVWSVAAAREEREAVASLAIASAQEIVQAAPVATTYTNVDLETRARVAAANERQAGKPTSRCKAPVSKGFSLLK